jgi:hypothetical protein
MIKYFKTKGVFYIEMIKRTAIIGALGMILINLPNLTIEMIHYRNHPDFIKACKLYLDNPQNEELRKKCQLEYINASCSKDSCEEDLEQIEKQ